MLAFNSHIVALITRSWRDERMVDTQIRPALHWHVGIVRRHAHRKVMRVV